MNEELVWTNQLSPKWRFGLIGVIVLIVIGVLVAMSTQALNTWLGILIMLALAVVIHMIHRIGTFLMIEDTALHYGLFPRPNGTVALRKIKSAQVEQLPEPQRMPKPWGSIETKDLLLVDANMSTHAVTIHTKDGRFIKVGVGPNLTRAEAFCEELRKRRGASRA